MVEGTTFLYTSGGTFASSTRQRIISAFSKKSTFPILPSSLRGERRCQDCGSDLSVCHLSSSTRIAKSLYLPHKHRPGETFVQCAPWNQYFHSEISPGFQPDCIKKSGPVRGLSFSETLSNFAVASKTMWTFLGLLGFNTAWWGRYHVERDVASASSNVICLACPLLTIIYYFWVFLLYWHNCLWLPACFGFLLSFSQLIAVLRQPWSGCLVGSGLISIAMLFYSVLVALCSISHGD